jgi:hypothetical protein
MRDRFVSKSILQFLGFNLDNIPPDAQWEFVWTSADALGSWRIFLFIGILLAIGWAVFYMYRREMDSCPAGARIFLGIVRALVMLTLAVVFLGPAIRVKEIKTRQDVILVLIDESLSMLTPDRYLDDEAVARVAKLLDKTPDQVRTQRPNRAVIINEILQREGGKFIADLAKQGNVKVSMFSTRPGKPQEFAYAGGEKKGSEAKEKKDKKADDKATPDVNETEAAPTTMQLTPSGQGTNIALAVREAIKSTPGSPIAAVIIITDGQQTVREDDPLLAADFAGDQKVPIFTLGVGDPSKKRNLKVNMAKANESVRRNNPFQIEAEIQAEGLEAQTVTVDLVARTMPGGGTGENVLQTRQVTLPSSIGADENAVATALEKISFEFNPQTAGDYEFAVRIQKIGRESDDDDNLSKPVRVKVRSDKSRVLLISGGPNWEYRPLQALLTRDNDINVSIWLQTMDLNMRQDGDIPIDHLPTTPKEMFEYDCIIMLDPDPKEFQPSWIETLRTYLGEQGGGLLYMPGPKYATQFLGGALTRGIQDFLPVRFGDMGSLDVKSLIASHTREWPLSLVPAEMDHPMLRFDTTNPAINDAVWAAFPGIFWSFPVLSAKPATRTLIEHSDPALRSGRDKRPLMVTGLYGPGRIAYVGFNGTWRWRRIGADAMYYEKFWIQTVNYLIAGRDQRGSNRGYIDIVKSTFHKGDQIKVEARLYDPSFNALDQQTVDGTLKAGNVVVPVKFERVGPDAPGMYQASITAVELGPHEIAIQLEGADPGKPIPPIVKGFDVGLPRVEMEVTRLNKQMLTEMADRSNEGRYFEVDQWNQIAAAVPNKSLTIEVPRKPYELWSTDRLLILLVLLLTIEWAVRKKYKLM